MRNTLTIARRELTTYFNTPVAYVVVPIFLVMTGGWLFGTLFFQNEASLRSFFTPFWGSMTPNFFSAPFALAIFAPLVTMRLLAEEQQSGTLEVLMTLPVGDWEIVLGKYLGGLVIMFITVALLMVLPVILDFFAASSGTGGTGGIEWSTTFAAYFGLFLWSATALAVGMFISSLTDSQIVAAIISILMLLLLWLATWMAGGLDGSLRDAVAYLSASQHLVNFVRGVFELKDVFYYLSWIVLAVFLTHRAIEAQRWA